MLSVDELRCRVCKKKNAIIDNREVRTRASEETRTLTWRLRPLGQVAKFTEEEVHTKCSVKHGLGGDGAQIAEIADITNALLIFVYEEEEEEEGGYLCFIWCSLLLEWVLLGTQREMMYVFCVIGRKYKKCGSHSRIETCSHSHGFCSQLHSQLSLNTGSK